jgi:hypothetical protein
MKRHGANRGFRERHAQRARLQTQYTIAELSEMSGLPVEQVRRYLKGKGVLLERAGKRNFIVYLGMLQTKAKDFWDSILRREQLRLQPELIEEPDED